MFKWICLMCAVAFGAIVLWMVNDLRMDAKTKLADISDKTKVMAETGKDVATDIKDLRSLAGIAVGQERFVTYADEVLGLIQAQEGAEIGVTRDMKNAEAVSVWINGARKEAVMLVIAGKSKQEILSRLCHTMPPLRREFFIRLPGQKPRSLEEWVRDNHPGSRE